TIQLNGMNFTTTGAVGGSAVSSATIINSANGSPVTYTATSLPNSSPKMSGNMNVTLLSSWNPAVDHDFTGTFAIKSSTAPVTVLVAANTELGSPTGLIQLDASGSTAAANTANFNFSTSSPSNNQFETITRN